MFVFANKIIIKTCGSTTLLLALEALLQIASKCDLTEVDYLFYSRKNFLEPEQQLFPHRGFEEEFSLLEHLFPEGHAYTLGQVNGDHWNIFILENEDAVQKDHDQTFEILMHDLDPEAAKIFYRDESFVSSRNTTIKSRISELLPGAILDDLVFNPCGYSINAILGPYYFTIHVTPQQEFSYASFETNYPFDSTQLDETTKKVLSIFRPGRFTVTFLASSIKNNVPTVFEKSKSSHAFKRTFKRMATSAYDFQQYHLRYAHFNSH